MTNELKPRPFCGGEATVFASDVDGVFVVCMNCQVRTHNLVDTLVYGKATNAVEEVIKAWNRRVDDE